MPLMPLRYLRGVVRELTPPIFSKVLRRLGRGMIARPEPRGEKDPAWYDHAFEESAAQNVHYTESPYYPIWAIIMDRIRAEPNKSILEIACGAGQLARALNDSGLIDSYSGFDFSPKRVARARTTCPELNIEVDDAFTTTLFETFPYRIVIATEFLEHVEADLVVLDRIKPQTRFIGTVPSYPWTSHVRHFQNVTAVVERYGRHFRGLDVFPILRKKTGQTIFVMDGKKV